MAPPLIATPAADSPATCSTCGSTLVRTGKASTFVDAPGTNASRVDFGGPRPEIVRGFRPLKGWVPSLLVTVCPTCDGPTERVVDPDAPAPEPAAPPVDPARAAYLRKLNPFANEDDGA